MAEPSGERLLIAQGRSYLISTSQVRESAQDAGRTIHVLKDMTGQREAERRYRELFESIQEGLFFCDLDGRIRRSTTRSLKCWGLDRGSELRGRLLGFLVPAARRRELESALESARAGQQIWNLELPLRRSDGGARQYSLNLSPMCDETGGVRGIVGSVADVTDASVLRAKLMQAGKMAAVGQLVAGVAHEVNNPLSAILGFSQLLLENPEIPKSAREELGLILQEAQRTKSIVANLLQFARPAAVQSERVNVNDVVRQTLQLRGRDFGTHEVDVFLSLNEKLAGVVGDAQQLQQVFLNILNNAFDAVLRGARARANRNREWAERFACGDYFSGQRAGNRGHRFRVRSFLQHEGSGKRDGARAEHLLRNRAGAWRRDILREQRGGNGLRVSRAIAGGGNFRRA